MSKSFKRAHVKLLNWRTSQVLTPQAACLASEQPLLVLTGDWASDSSFDGCVAAAAAAVDLLAKKPPPSDPSPSEERGGTLPKAKRWSKKR